MATPTEENYLKALFQLSSESGEVSVSALSAVLNVSKPTANSMVKNLKEQGLVVYEKYRPLLLTDQGRKAAALVIRKHRLTEMFLVEKMGFGWDEVHEIAEQVEHIKSPAFFDRMNELMDYPTEDPHGSPIPDKEGKIIQQHYKRLSDCKTGDHVKLTALRQSSKEFLTFLDDRGLSLGTTVTIEVTEPFDKSLVIQHDNKKISLSFEVSEKLMVEVQ
ncbi:metal-dependent transcriptional regulator [Fulvivirga sp. M361]|uniref:metal-dependent transcriptional regulator n=1 Tax=Fulvivirga sp. M361 TaxID=2594266 RepID=UPI00117A84C6|nr:metal-dependent transcriptional regulator [Fulvivirga sp. M361]TRX47268.1 metal-dependent transcriptional regulator [Fulvivirga sp. M361]